MIGFESFSPHSWLDSIFTLRSHKRPGVRRQPAQSRRGKWMRTVALGVTIATVSGFTAATTISIADTGSTEARVLAQSEAVTRDPGSAAVELLTQRLTELRKQIRHGKLVNPNAETLALADEAAKVGKNRRAEWISEVAQSFKI